MKPPRHRQRHQPHDRRTATDDGAQPATRYSAADTDDTEAMSFGFSIPINPASRPANAKTHVNCTCKEKHLAPVPVLGSGDLKGGKKGGGKGEGTKGTGVQANRRSICEALRPFCAG